jgi:hypothetical protein
MEKIWIALKYTVVIETFIVEEKQEQVVADCCDICSVVSFATVNLCLQ